MTEPIGGNCLKVVSKKIVDESAKGEPKEVGDAVLTLPDGTTINLPTYEDHSGAKFVDIRTLQPKLGVCTYDPGYSSTASCLSSITYIDGVKGILRYRGYDVEELARKSDFYDASFLVLYGELPTHEQKEAWRRNIADSMLVHEQLAGFIRSFRYDSHPMAVLVGVVGALSAFFPEFSNVQEEKWRERACLKMIAVMPTLAAMSYKTSIGEPIVYPRSDLTYVDNFLHMMFSRPTEPYVVDPVLSRALEIILITHMDHEQNASTTTVRTAGSSLANPLACVASGISALWGPQHGGANEAVLRMLEGIGSVDRVPLVIARAKDKNDSFRLMGFGHRVYKTFDPRARIMREQCQIVLEHLGVGHDPLLEVAQALEKAALEDPYFRQRALYPNVDFYSGIVLRALGVPTSAFTVIFALSRTVGWLSQWMEMVRESPLRIVRPRQLYLGVMERPFITVNERDTELGFRAADWHEEPEKRLEHQRRLAAKGAMRKMKKQQAASNSYKELKEAAAPAAHGNGPAAPAAH